MTALARVQALRRSRCNGKNAQIADVLEVASGGLHRRQQPGERTRSASWRVRGGKLVEGHTEGLKPVGDPIEYYARVGQAGPDLGNG
jgi:hypothetical protein